MPNNNFYNPYQQYQPNFYQPPIQIQQQAPQQNQMTQIQNGGFISVPNENIARNYPVAPGNSITFKDENAPYVYTKTMGFSQLDRPAFEKYRLVKEEASDFMEQGIDFASKENINNLEHEIQKIWEEINALKHEEKTIVEREKKDGES